MTEYNPKEIEIFGFLKQLMNTDLLVKSLDLSGENSDFLRIKDHHDFDLGFAKILNRRRKIIDEKFSEQEFQQVTLEIRAIQLCVRIEAIKYKLALLLDPSKLRYSKEIRKNIDVELKSLTLGNLVDRINYKLFPITNLEEEELDTQMKKRKDIEELFIVDFRNHIVHRDFEKHEGKIIYGNPIKIIDEEKIKKLKNNVDILDLMVTYQGIKAEENS